VDLDAKRRDLVDLAVELPAITAIDVRENGDGMLDLAIGRLEDDHACRVDAAEHRRPSAGARFFADVRARLGVVDIASDDVAAVFRNVCDVRAYRDLIEARDRRVGDVLDGDAVQAGCELLFGELLFRDLLSRRTSRGKAERQGEQGC
jgi:hypothetical protein